MMVFRIVILIASVLMLAVGAAQAAPHRQDPPRYELTTVREDNPVVTSPGISQAGVALGATTATSDFPNGIYFESTLTVDAGVTVDTVRIVPLRDGLIGFPQDALWDEASGQLRGDMFTGGFGIPLWSTYTFFWEIALVDGTTIRSPTGTITYSEPTQEWYRAESDDIVVYWAAMDGLAPDAVADQLTQSAANAVDLFNDVFAGPLEEKPHIVIFPNTPDWAIADIEDLASSTILVAPTGQSNPLIASITFSLLGDWPNALPPDCRQTDTSTDLVRFQSIVQYGLPYQLAVLYSSNASELLQTPDGPLPSWYQTGQPHWLALYLSNSTSYDTVLPAIAASTAQGLPSLEAFGGGFFAFALDYEPCSEARLNAGASFLNWLWGVYGFEVTEFAVEDWRTGANFVAALEAQTGATMFELENAWRFAVGLPLLDLRDVDPVAALAPATAAIYAVGDSVTLSNPRPIIVREKPGDQFGQQCYAGTTVTVLSVGALDGINWYQIECGLVGWVREEELY